MIKNLIERLYKLFPLYPVPDPQGIDFPNDWEARDDCSVLWGKSWEQIKPEELQLHWSVISWLDADYFHYYLPSIILLSLQEMESSQQISHMELPVDSVMYYIAKGDVFDEKWKSFSLDQMIFIKKWYLLVLEKENNKKIEWHRRNIEELIDRLFLKK